MNHVIEHLPNPKETLQEIKRILRKDGLLLITTPNFDSINAKIFKENWFPLEIPRHLYLFTPVTLKKLLNSVGGFRLNKIKYDVSTYSLMKSMEYWLEGRDKIKNILVRFRLLFLPLTIIQALVRKSDVMTFYVYRE
jgi:SAM-dependent methyltransferase